MLWNLQIDKRVTETISPLLAFKIKILWWGHPPDGFILSVMNIITYFLTISAPKSS